MISNIEIGYNGRLGNQMFQYAVCYAISKKIGTDFFIPKENVENIKENGCWDYSNNKWVPYNFRLYDCFNITVQQRYNIKLDNIFNEPHFHYTDLINFVEDNTSIQGYYQSEKYFVNYKNEILNEFSFNNEIISEANEFIKNFRNNEIVSVHVRRGDNVTNPTFPLVSIDYIQSALQIFSDKEYNFLIISDDVDWCKSVFPEDANIKISNGESDFVDLCLMSISNHNIISNSSFSWWGAYLNKNENKKVIAPSDWFKDKVNMNTKDLIPQNWIIL